MSDTTTRKFSIDVLWNIGSIVILAVGGVGINSLILGLEGAAALGVFNQVYAIYIILSQIGVGGLQHSVLKQVSYTQSDLRRCADVTTVALVLIFAITIPISTAGILLADSIGALLDSPDVADGLVVVMPGLVFFAANKVLINVLNGLRRMRIYAGFRSLRFILIPVFLLLIILSDAPVGMLPLALTLTELVLFLILIVFVYTRLIPMKTPQGFIIHAREHISYGVRGMLSGVLIELNTRIDVLMLSLFVSDGVVGLYSFAAILAEGFAQIPIAVRYNVDPLMGEYFANDQRERITQLARRIRRVFLPAMIALGIVSTAMYPVVFMILSDSDGLQTSWLVFVIIASAHIAVAGYAPMRGILLQGNAPGSYTATILGTAIFNVTLNALLIPVLGVYGAAVATGCSIILEIIVIIVLSRRRFGVRL